MSSVTTSQVSLEEQHLAQNYHPLPVVLSEGSGVWVTDTEGRRYLDCLAGYSALNFGHRHPLLVGAATQQLARLTLTSRAFHHDQLGPWAAELCALTGTEMVLPMNTGAEGVETALKVARKWGYRRKGVAPDRASVVVAGGNFHGRTISIISFSDDASAREDFGPYTPGFRSVSYGDLGQLAAAVDESTVAVLLEPVQGEAGVVVPPDDYLVGVRGLCNATNTLLIADEVQSGLGRAGHTLACQHWNVEADLYVLGKALGGGILPMSAVAGRREVLGVLRPGEHGSTFGGNPLACAVSRAVIDLLSDGTLQQRSLTLGRRLHAQLDSLIGTGLTAVRSIGLWAGVDVAPEYGTGRQICERLLQHGVLAKDAHGQTIRLSPPLIAEEDHVDLAVSALASVLRSA